MDAFLKTGKLGDSKNSDSKPEIKEKSKISKKISEKNVPWVEKYRPRTVEDVIEQKEIVATLKNCLKGADLPHFLFYGPPGTGKTSTIIAAARQLFGDLYKERILELNASDDRGIQVIRDKVKTFAQTTVTSVAPDGRNVPSFKIVILDEADSMTSAAQAALRRTIEKETKSTRFCLICNYISCIIEPLTSRCAKYRFKPLGKDIMISRLSEICAHENVSYEENALIALVDMSGGDMRRAITCLQSCARLKGEERIYHTDVLEVTGIVPEFHITELFELCCQKNYLKVESYIEKLMMTAYCAPQIIEQIHDLVVQSCDIVDEKKALILEKLAICAWRLQEGASEYVQLLDLCCCIIQSI